MRIAGYQCDICGIVKGEANHWWLLMESEHLDSVELTAWEADAADADNVRQHLCGEQCVGKAVSQWMKEQHATVTTTVGGNN